jgi:hypothetical protein
MKNSEVLRLVIKIFNDDGLKINLNKDSENYNITITDISNVEINIFNYDESNYSDNSVVDWFVEFELNGEYRNLKLDLIEPKLNIIKNEILPLLIYNAINYEKIMNLYTKIKLNDKNLLRSGTINSIIN